MRFFHLSDLHIGLKLMNHEQREDQTYIFYQIADAIKERKPDALVVAGDLFDRSNPSAESYAIFDAFISMLREADPNLVIMMISGNHDSGVRINTYRNILKTNNIYMIGLPPVREEETIEKVVLRDEYGEVNFYLLPFTRPAMLRKLFDLDEEEKTPGFDESIHRLLAREEIDETKRNVLVSHQFYLPVGKTPDEIERMDSEVLAVGNIDQVSADVLSSFDYAALGHIHKPMTVGEDRFRYVGTPLACSVSEAGQTKQILEIELGEKGRKDSLTITSIPLKPLHEVRVISGSLEEVLTQASEDYVTVVLLDNDEESFYEVKDRIYHAFPNLLELRRIQSQTEEDRTDYEPVKLPDTLSICSEFLGGLAEDEENYLRDIINEMNE